MPKILVTGGAGFIGSHLVDEFIMQNHQVIVVDDLSTGKKENLNPQAKFYQLKIQDRKLSLIFKKEKPAIVCHLAAQMNVRRSIVDPIFDAQSNIIGSLNLLENCVKYKIKKFIFISSGGAIYGDGVKIPTLETEKEQPLSPYGIAKLALEKYLYYYSNQHRLPYTILRLANIYGPRQNYLGEAGVVAVFGHQLISKKSLWVNGGQQTRDFVYVADVVSAVIKALPKQVQGIFNIGTGKQTNIDNLAKKMIQISQTKVFIKHRPYVTGEQMKSCLSFNKIKHDLNWQPQYDLNKGLKQTWDWFKAN
ncbi:UDP-glucose 4-epimerase [Candidatus Kuenenbacteria bacterium CG_4_8_14_3_um_filter_39_15]|uniref:UDP-glucose 4-epimerase n=1 Tax=Candidatus Kuenenbacteria bacterium CG_4_8_14_3_um_filter_39_15 TaxID=1974615 RepID=A0A2M7ILU8_9BACT|nr:MAG: UDP-glucose 4-epimerase [Candidatus Kuenenbacteria bacterium CG_4_8_14_3_um_filter_39_15]